MTSFNTIDEAIHDISNGKMVIVVDDENRENEGDLVMAAHFVTPEAINFMIHYAKGLVCVPVVDSILDRFHLKDMVSQNSESMKTAFTVSVDGAANHGITTGISAEDRAKTIQLFINPNSTYNDVVTPGHIFPLRAQEMGVLRRAGHTEAAVDLARLAGLAPAGVICEIIKDDGHMARVPDLFDFAKDHHLTMISIEDLIRFRLNQERCIQFVEKIPFPTAYGDFDLLLFKDLLTDRSHVAIIKGVITSDKAIPVLFHSESIFSDVFHSLDLSDNDSVAKSLTYINKKGIGVLLYLRQDYYQYNLVRAIKTLHQDSLEKNNDSLDSRDYGIGAQILVELGVKTISLLSDSTSRMIGLEGYGIHLKEQITL